MQLKPRRYHPSLHSLINVAVRRTSNPRYILHRLLSRSASPMHRDAILSYGLSLSLDFSISSSPGEEIDFHDRLNFPGYETYQQQRGFDPWNTFTFIRSNKSKSKLISFLPIGFPRYANIARISCNSYSNR